MIGFSIYSKACVPKIMSNADERLVEIDTEKEGFFDVVLNFQTTDEKINMFKEAIEEVKNQGIKKFWKPMYDPSDEEDKSFSYEAGKKTSTGKSFEWWKEKIEGVPQTIEKNSWHMANEYEYYAILVAVVNKLVESGKSVKEALNLVVKDSSEMGPAEYEYRSSQYDPKVKNVEKTGSLGYVKVPGMYDLGNVDKILICSNYENAGDFWISSVHVSLAELTHYDSGETSKERFVATACIILR